MDKTIVKILNESEKVIVGKRDKLEKVLMAILADGHILLEDVPGVGKTTMALTLSKVLGLNFNRIQFTPDVLPSDIVGFSIYNNVTNEFEYKPGIVNETNILLADEINRTSSKTQSALLETMEERQVTVDGNTYELRKPFIVIATENEIGSVGTHKLPTAQLDRFLIKTSIGYPDLKSQMKIIQARQETNPLDSVNEVINEKNLIEIQDTVRNVNVDEKIIEYIARIAMQTQESPLFKLGISPRGAIAINKMAKAKAVIEGRDYVIPEDVSNILYDVCAHRVILSSEAKINNMTQKEAFSNIIKKVNVPDKVR